MGSSFWDWAGQNYPDLQRKYCSVTSDPVCCFKSGSRILTARGEVPVEDLKVGDRIVTLQNGELPIRWLGWRRISLTAHPEPARAAPIRIAQGALGENTPHRDLHVSPDHAMYLNGVLINASALLNGVSVTQSTPGEVVYYHVELNEHAIIFAEGAATESFLGQEGDRSYFSNSTTVTALHPWFGADPVRECRGRAMGPRVHDRLLAWTAGAGRRLCLLTAKLGLSGVAGAAAKLNGWAMQRLNGTVAPHVSFGPALDDARRQIAARAQSGHELETSRQNAAA